MTHRRHCPGPELETSRQRIEDIWEDRAIFSLNKRLTEWSRQTGISDVRIWLRCALVPVKVNLDGTQDEFLVDQMDTIRDPRGKTVNHVEKMGLPAPTI
jgi:hypothetical protein